MNRINGNQDKQTLFDAMMVLGKAEKNDKGRVIYENGKIRNITLADKIKTGISSFLGNKKLNELKSSIAKENAKLFVENKIKENLKNKCDKNQGQDITDSSIEHAYLPHSISSNFLENAIALIKNKEEHSFHHSPTEKIKQTSKFDTTLINETNVNITILEKIVNDELAHLPALVKAAIHDPTIEKFINLVLETRENSAASDKAGSDFRKPEVFIEMARQAKRIHDVLGCNSKMANLIATQLIRKKERDQDAGTLISTLKRRANYFLLAKEKFDIGSVTATGYALLMDHSTFNSRLPSADIKEVLNIVDQTFSKVTKENKAEFLGDPAKFLNQAIDEHLKSLKIKEYETHIKRNEFIFFPSTRKKYAAEMADKAYASLTDEQKLEAAKIYFHNLPKLKENPGKVINRKDVAEQAKLNVLD